MTGLTGRLALAMSGVALVAALLAGLLTAPLLSSATEQATRQPLARQAELLARLRLPALASARADGLAGRADLSLGVVTADGERTGAAATLSAAQVTALLAGRPISTEGSLGGADVLVEARPARSGGAVVLAADADAVATTSTLLRRRVLLAIALGLLAALATAWVVAARLSRPLRDTAAAARRLAAGQRGVPLPRAGTTEIADVTAALGVLDTALVTSEGRQRAFLLSVSHELRTPLTTLRGYAEALSDGVIDAEEAAAAGRTMRAETDRLQRYVDDLLALARLEADDFSLHPGTTDVSTLLTTAAATWADRAGRAGISVVTQTPPDLVVITDAARLRQVVDALVDNAVRVCASGDRVVLAAARSESGARVEIRDSGPGLTGDDRSVAFEPGVLHERYAGSRPGGHGLGLAIVHRLVSRLGGSIDVVAAPEGGAAFVVELPGQPPVGGSA